MRTFHVTVASTRWTSVAVTAQTSEGARYLADESIEKGLLPSGKIVSQTSYTHIVAVTP